MKNKIYIYFVGILICCIGCKKFLTIDPPQTQIISTEVYQTDISAVSAIQGIYSYMSTGSLFSGDVNSITFLAGFSGDELTELTGEPEKTEFYQNSLTPFNSIIRFSVWQSCYKIIYYSNLAIEQLSRSASLTDTLKKQLEGEARTIRAFTYFYLTNLFGDIPLITTSDYRKNAVEPQSGSSKIYDQIILDLTAAEGLLSSDYSFADNQRIRINKWAAKALLARTYLFMNKWEEAESQAGSVIDNNSMFVLETDLNSVFLKDSREAIFQLLPVLPGRNTNEGYSYLQSTGDRPYFASLSKALVESFEANDLRKSLWVDTIVSSTVGNDTFFSPVKYKVLLSDNISEYSVVLRLAEMYLIRAEARLKQGKIAECLSDLNYLRNRAGLNDILDNDPEVLALKIEEEQYHELFSEWGHRWLNLKRTGRAGEVLSGVKSPNWSDNDTLYPIPNNEIKSNPNLIQNTGY